MNTIRQLTPGVPNKMSATANCPALSSWLAQQAAEQADKNECRSLHDSSPEGRITTPECGYGKSLHTSSHRCDDSNYFGDNTHYWVLVVVVVVVPVLEPSPPPVAASATPTAELGRRGGGWVWRRNYRPKPTLLPTLLLRRTGYRCSPRRSRRKRYGKNAIQSFFHNNFPSSTEWEFTQKHFGRD